MAYYRPPLCSERFAGVPSYDDCGPCSVVMLENANKGRVVSGCSQAEAYEVRRDGGAPANGFTSNRQMADALRKRGVPIVDYAQGGVFDFANIWPRLTPGRGAAVFGRMGRFPRTHRLRRWQPSYTGGHVVCVLRLSAKDEVWWMDPLAKTGWPGEIASKANLRTFLGGDYSDIGQTALIAPIAQVSATVEEGMIYIAERDMTLRSGATIYQHPNTSSAKVGTTSAANVVRTVGRPQNGNAFDTNWWGIRWSTAVPTGGAATSRVCYVRSADMT